MATKHSTSIATSTGPATAISVEGKRTVIPSSAPGGKVFIEGGNSIGGIAIAGTLPDVAALPPSGQKGDVYLIAGNLHVWNGHVFVNAGPIVGPAGPPGHPGQIRFTGNGPPPAVIVGAEPGDTYLDTLTGNIYTVI